MKKNTKVLKTSGENSSNTIKFIEQNEKEATLKEKTKKIWEDLFQVLFSRLFYLLNFDPSFIGYGQHRSAKDRINKLKQQKRSRIYAIALVFTNYFLDKYLKYVCIKGLVFTEEEISIIQIGKKSINEIIYSEQIGMIKEMKSFFEKFDYPFVGNSIEEIIFDLHKKSPIDAEKLLFPLTNLWNREQNKDQFTNDKSLKDDLKSIIDSEDLFFDLYKLLVGGFMSDAWLSIPDDTIKKQPYLNIKEVPDFVKIIVIEDALSHIDKRDLHESLKKIIDKKPIL